VSPRFQQPRAGRREWGFTLVELLVTATISALIVAGLGSVLNASMASKASLEARMDLTRQASFAMERMVRAVSHSRALLLPLADNPATNWREHVREQTVPPSLPEGDSTLATAVLAVTLPAFSDLDFDGFPDADDDRDGFIDEDPGGQQTSDTAAGLYLIDDDGDGLVDESTDVSDDDEDGAVDEDPINGIDDDADGSIDEDSPADANNDGCPGVCAVDDDADSSIDEGGTGNDDENGSANDDGYNPVVFSMSAGTLLERTPVPWDENGSGSIEGRDFLSSVIASQVTRLRFERIASAAGPSLIDITLELTDANGQTASLNRRVRVGGAL